MKIRELMTSKVHCCRPLDSLETAARMLWDHDCGVLPVVDKEGRVGAMITDRDICMAASMTGRPLAELRVAETMSDGVVSCTPEDEVYVALKLMADYQLRRLPVVDPEGRLCGIITLNDLAVAGERQSRLGRGALKVLTAVCRHRSGSPALRKTEEAPADEAAAEV